VFLIVIGERRKGEKRSREEREGGEREKRWWHNFYG
jgi:hypothetical protein